MELGSVFLMAQGDDVARKSWNIRKKIREYQESFTVLEKVLGLRDWGLGRCARKALPPT